MLYEDLRSAHEDIERIESAIADRQYETKHLRQRLKRDHEISALLSRLQQQSERALDIYKKEQQRLLEEVQSISTGEPLDAFYERLGDIKDYHERYPGEPVENLERFYRNVGGEGEGSLVGDLDGMFTGEEQFGQFFDLTQHHEQYLNLPGVRSQRKIGYTQYLDVFDIFIPPQNSLSRHDKLTEDYFSYVTALAQYLESFIRRTRPLENLETLFNEFSEEFETQWEGGSVPGWEPSSHAHTNGGASAHPATEGTGEGVWCADCQKEFKNDNVYKAHLTGKKHIKNAELRQQQQNGGDTEMTNGTSATSTAGAAQRLKEKAIAEREHRVRRLSSALKTVREETRVNVERKAGMTDRERQQELAALYAEDDSIGPLTRRGGDNEEEEDDGDEKVYNPLKLPLAWDGKPIPFWLYKLHGLGVEFPCEICGSYVYMGRRAFDKHFSEARHVYGLKCLGITGNLGLFREITGIEEAMKLWEKVLRDKQRVEERGGGRGGEGLVEMEDTEGNVMPARVYEDLRRQGLL